LAAAFDTNILAYAAGLRRVDADEAKIVRAGLLIAPMLAEGDLVVPAQVLAELHNLLRKKAKFTPSDAAARVAEYADAVITIPTDLSVLEDAFELASTHGLQTYDAIILAAAAQGGCEVLYSEDMQHGFEWNGVLVVNPFT
jgi:predicted nucleic acid-binding protein